MVSRHFAVMPTDRGRGNRNKVNNGCSILTSGNTYCEGCQTTALVAKRGCRVSQFGSTQNPTEHVLMKDRLPLWQWCQTKWPSSRFPSPTLKNCECSVLSAAESWCWGLFTVTIQTIWKKVKILYFDKVIRGLDLAVTEQKNLQAKNLPHISHLHVSLKKWLYFGIWSGHHSSMLHWPNYSVTFVVSQCPDTCILFMVVAKKDQK